MLRLLLLTLALFASSARADVPPPNTTGCSTKKAGDACDTDDSKKGACKEATCSRLDYSQGTPPRSIEVPCLKCEPKVGGCAAVGMTPLVGLAGLLLRRRVKVGARRPSRGS